MKSGVVDGIMVAGICRRFVDGLRLAVRYPQAS